MLGGWHFRLAVRFSEFSQKNNRTIPKQQQQQQQRCQPASPSTTRFQTCRAKHKTPKTFDLYEYLGSSWGLIFMHPGDFTPVCTTEVGEAAKRSDEFAKRDIKLCGFSCNDAESHRKWIKDVEAATGGRVDFPMVADGTREIATRLGFLDEANKNSKGLPLTVRSCFFVKPDKTIALMMTYPATTGRSFDEILRVADSLQRTAVSKAVATPVDWQPGQDCLVNFPLTNKQADEKFGVGGYKVIKVPSEQTGQVLEKNYLRVVPDLGK